MKLIKNGRIHNALQREAFIADILMKDDKISRIEENISSIGLDGVEIIDADHVVAFFEQPFAEMGAEKAAAAGHQNGFIFHCDS